MLLRFSHHKESNQVGHHGHHVKGGGHVVAVVQVVDQPHDLGEQDHDFELCGAGGVQEPGEQGCGNKRQPGDQIGAQGAQGQKKLQADEEELQPGGDPVLYEYQIPDDGDDVADKAADTAQDQVSEAHEAALNALGNEDVGFLFQQADGHHNEAADHGNGIAEDKCVHRGPPWGSSMLSIPKQKRNCQGKVWPLRKRENCYIMSASMTRRNAYGI